MLLSRLRMVQNPRENYSENGFHHGDTHIHTSKTPPAVTAQLIKAIVSFKVLFMEPYANVLRLHDGLGSLSYDINRSPSKIQNHVPRHICGVVENASSTASGNMGASSIGEAASQPAPLPPPLHDASPAQPISPCVFATAVE